MDVRGVSRRFGAVALVLGPLALVGGSLWESAGDNDSVATSLTKIAAHGSDQRVLVVADLIAAFMLPATLYLMRLSRRGAPRLAAIGGTIAFVGWLGGIISLGGSDVLLYHASRLPDRATAVTLVKSVVNDPGFVVPEATFLIGHLVGMLLLGIGLWRSRAVPVWAAVLVGIGPIVHLFVHDAVRVVDAGAYALVLIGMTWCAVSLLRVRDDEWDLPVRPRAAAQVSQFAVPAPTGVH